MHMSNLDMKVDLIWFLGGKQAYMSTAWFYLPIFSSLCSIIHLVPLHEEYVLLGLGKLVPLSCNWRSSISQSVAPSSSPPAAGPACPAPCVWLKRVQSLQILSPSKVFPKKEIKHVYPKRFACAPSCQLLFLHLERLLPSRLSYFSSLPSSQYASSTFPPALCDLLLTSLILSLWPMFHLICI